MEFGGSVLYEIPGGLSLRIEWWHVSCMRIECAEQLLSKLYNKQTPIVTGFALSTRSHTHLARASSCGHTSSLKRSASAGDANPSARWCAELVWSYSRVKYSRGRPIPACRKVRLSSRTRTASRRASRPDDRSEACSRPNAQEWGGALPARRASRSPREPRAGNTGRVKVRAG